MGKKLFWGLYFSAFFLSMKKNLDSRQLFLEKLFCGLFSNLVKSNFSQSKFYYRTYFLHKWQWNDKGILCISVKIIIFHTQSLILEILLPFCRLHFLCRNFKLYAFQLFSKIFYLFLFFSAWMYLSSCRPSRLPNW